MPKTLKILRVSIALIVFILFFLSFSIVSDGIGSLNDIVRFQFIPSFLAFLSGGALIFIFFILLTFIFGRVYCSFLCPLGVMQDIISRFASIFKTKKQKRTKYSKPYSLLRLIVIFAVTVTVIIGSLSVLLWLDPYSNFGRIATNLFIPLERLINNVFSNMFPDYIFYLTPTKIAIGSFLWALAFFLIVAVMSAFRGRLFCNTLCPVGTILGYISNISLFRLTINKDKCVGCHVCTKHCKSECIDGDNQIIDNSRCVMCLNCLSSCSSNAIEYKFRYGKDNKKALPPTELEMNGRREAIASIGAVTAMLAARGFASKRKNGEMLNESSKIGGMVPPGGVGIEHLKDHCTSCHACIKGCPSTIIHPATGEYGLGGLFLPVISYEDRFCGYDCHTCSDICPNGALLPISLEEKRLTAIGKVQFDINKCIVNVDGTDCGACDEHCPTKAIRMVPFRDDLLIPSVHGDLCIGCGACEYICPVKAMKVHPLTLHEKAKTPSEDSQKEVKVDDFGF